MRDNRLLVSFDDHPEPVGTWPTPAEREEQELAYLNCLADAVVGARLRGLPGPARELSAAVAMRAQRRAG